MPIDQDCMRKETFDINKFLVSRYFSGKIMHPIRKLSRHHLRMRIRNTLNKLS